MIKQACFLLGFLMLVLACNETKYVQGQRLYDFYCGNCHMEDGSGLVKNIPPLKNEDYLMINRLDVPCIIKHGIEGDIIVNNIKYNQRMEGVPHLSEAEISNITNYIFTAWGNDIPVLNIKEIKQSLENCNHEE